MADITQINIAHQTGEYDILIGSGLRKQLSEYFNQLQAEGPVGIITNSTVNDLYGDDLRESLKTAGIVTRTIIIPDGEKYKTLASAEQVMTALISQGMERSGTIITLGGGVVTDLGGFIASILFRGVKLIHIPTTLLAMVDASVGGKTGVNHTSGKNLIGSFYQPDLVVMDIDTLESLDSRDRISGYAEMLKMGAIKDPSYFNKLVAHQTELAGKNPGEILIQSISRSCELKAGIVESDEKEAGLRRILNFGHTVGHAIENTLGYGEIRHGEAIILGMYAAGWLSNQLELLDAAEWRQLQEILVKITIPVSLENLNPVAIEQATQLDKKVAQSKLHFILLRKIGETHIQSGISPMMVKLSVEAIKTAWSNAK